MAGGPSTTDRPKSSSAVRKSRWESPSSSAAATTAAAAAAAANPKPQPQPQPSKPNPYANPNPKPKSSPKPAPSPKPTPPVGPPHHHHNHHPPPPAPPQPTYGFHMLERRTITLADGSVRSYHALPPDYQDFPLLIPPPRLLPPLGPGPGPVPLPGPRPSQHQDYWNSLGLDSGKRKFGDGEESSRAAKQMRPGGIAGNGSGGGGGGGGDRQRPAVVVATKHSDVDQGELKKAFLKFVKTVNDPSGQRRSYLENGRLHCPACPVPATGRSSKDFPDTHSLVMHSYNSGNADLYVDHLGLHKALCAMMGWNYSMPPDNSKAYHYLPADDAAAIQGDLILWPPTVIIHNTLTGKNIDGRMEGLGNKYMDNRIKDLGFSGGKSKSLYGRDGHLGTTLIKFSADQTGLKEAMRLADYFQRNNHGRNGWARLQPLTLGGPEDETNPLIVNLEERSRDKKRIFYGYLGTASDMDKIDFETRKRIAVESLKEYRLSQ